MATNRAEAICSSRLFQRAVCAFKSQDYPRATHFLDQAFLALPSESTTLKINILDSRAAAKEKINDLKGGLADAKAVIDLAPDSPKGYIRAARLFQKIGRFSASVKMFERAIVKLSSNSKKNSPIIELLKTELKQARLKDLTSRTAAASFSGPSDSSNPSKSKFDPSVILPFELFITTISFLDPSTRIRCMAVCQSWRNAIMNTPNLWTSLSLSSRDYLKLMAKAKFWLSQLGPIQNLQTLSIKVCPIWPPSTTRNLLAILSGNLSSSITTRLPTAGLRSFSFHVGGTSHAIGEIQRIFSDVLAFVYLNRTNLETLEIQVPAFITCPLPLNVFLAKFPRLKELKLQGERGQFLLLQQSDEFLRTSFPSSKTIDIASSSAENNSSLAQTDPVCSVVTSPNLDTELETLFLQCASFTPSSDGPMKVVSLRSVSLISTVLNAATMDPVQIDNSNQYVPGIDFSCLPRLENLELSRMAVGQEQWEPVWRSCERLPRLKRLRLEGLPHFIPHFLELANIPADWSPQGHADQPLRNDAESIVPQLECLFLSSLDNLMSYKFLAVFGHQFLKLDSLSVAGLLLDSTTEPLMIAALRHLPPLVNLNLSNTHATSELVEAIKPDRLDHLQLTNCTRVTFRSLARVMNHHLNFLDITNCQLISTREMIEWLAKRVNCLIWQASQAGYSKATKRLFLD